MFLGVSLWAAWKISYDFGMCKIYQTTTAINQFTSSIFLTVMSADRYIAVCHPISSPKFRTPVIARVVSLTAWTCSALLMVPVFMYASTITKQCGGQTCNIFWPFGEIDDDNETMIEEGRYFIFTIWQQALYFFKSLTECNNK